MARHPNGKNGMSLREATYAELSANGYRKNKDTNDLWHAVEVRYGARCAKQCVINYRAEWVNVRRFLDRPEKVLRKKERQDTRHCGD
jgi:hypothetical protein